MEVERASWWENHQSSGFGEHWELKQAKQIVFIVKLGVIYRLKFENKKF